MDFQAVQKDRMQNRFFVKYERDAILHFLFFWESRVEERINEAI
jgi:hypothetical protein